MNKSAIADVAIFLNGTPVTLELFTRGKYENYLTEDTKNWP